MSNLYIFDENDELFRDPGGAFETPGSLDLSIKLLRGAATGARLRFSLDGREAVETPMLFDRVSGGYDVYRSKLTIDEPGLYWYSFLVDAVDGSVVAVPEQQGSAFQITTSAPLESDPEWIKGGFIYHIFVDRFCRGGELRLRPGAVFRSDWGGCPQYAPDEEGIVRNNDFFGGDLYGIIEKLPYLEDLGVTCLYLSPVFSAASNHKYDTGDFMQIDPAFGGDEAFRLLCKEAGVHGMKVILDGVFNHVGIDSRYFNIYGNYDSVGAFQNPQSPYHDWFTFRDDGTYDAWWGIKLLPALNKSNMGYKDFICGKDGVIAYWTKAGVAGWRLDVVDELPDTFLYPLCEAIKRENSDALIIGEVWEDASNKISYDVRRRYFLGGQLDSVTNYPLKEALISFLKYSKAEQLAATMDTLYRNYPKHARQTLMNILGTHDTARILTTLSDTEMPHSKYEMEHFRLSEDERAKARRRLILAATLQFTLPGVPCVYYGDEAGMEGCADPFNRRCYPWGGEDIGLVEWYKRLSSIRKRYSCFTDGKYYLVEARAGLFAFIRDNGANRVLIAVNNTDTDRTLSIDGFTYDILNDMPADALIVRAGSPGIYI
ncbi:MAG: glycoside hydrolase family 13 protein [Oscillospiraceae bacterium]|nr:glycoside hydrolase family 13 protein [Oscillospiraceae bacterium]MCL2125851.1 glycoside hydrolase family 13 protein [Oscillospiraceae bacterium]